MFFNNCIVCLSKLDSNTSLEHVVPDYLGGRLKIIILCDKCNHEFGAKLYSQFKFDVYIRKASYQLKDKLPVIYKSVENRQLYKTTNPLGVILPAKSNNRGISITPVLDEKSIVLPTNNAINYLEKQMRLKGESSEFAKIVSQGIWSIPNNKLMRISKDYKIIRWDATKFQLDYSKNSILGEIPVLLLAYEYLSLLIGRSIYKSYFNEIRQNIILNKLSDKIAVGFFVSEKVQPFHLIYPDYKKDKTIINIHIFEYLIVRVEFKGLHIEKGIEFCYLEDLVNKKSFGALTVKEGKANQWREMTF